MDKWLETRQLPTQLVSASGFVFTDDRILMVKSPKNGWEFPGGVSETGELIFDCLKREIYEESGIVVEPECLIDVYQRLNFKKGYGILQGEKLPPVTVFTFKCRYVEGTEMISEESSEIGWFTIDEIKQIISNPYTQKTFNDL